MRATSNIAGKEEITLPSGCAAGIYTSPTLLPLLATIFETSNIPIENLVGFASTFGRSFYGYPAKKEDEVVLRRVEGGKFVEKAYAYEREEGREWIVPFMAGEKLGWEIVL